MPPPSLLDISLGWGLIDLPLRASNEGSPRPRVARAQKIISLHPLFFSILLDGVLKSRLSPDRLSQDSTVLEFLKNSTSGPIKVCWA
jgi:hypothetical protein